MLSEKYMSHINNRIGSFFKKWATVYNYFFRNTTTINDCAIPDTFKRSSWRQYVNKLTSRTPVKNVWDMIRKVSGKNKKSECVHIKSSNGNMCYSTKDISNALGGNFQ